MQDRSSCKWSPLRSTDLGDRLALSVLKPAPDVRDGGISLAHCGFMGSVGSTLVATGSPAYLAGRPPPAPSWRRTMHRSLASIAQEPYAREPGGSPGLTDAGISERTAGLSLVEGAQPVRRRN